MKNLTFEQNIQQIAQNHSDCVTTSTEIQMGMRPEDLFLTGEEMGRLFQDVRIRVQNRVQVVHLYGLNMPIGFATSDYGDHRITLSVTDEPFNTIEGIRDYLVEQLSNDNEVYIYTINVVKVYNPTTLQQQKRFYIRCASIHRSRWEQLTEQAEANRDLHARLPWDHQPNEGNLLGDTVQQLNRWLGEREKKEPPINPKHRIKKHKF